MVTPLNPTVLTQADIPWPTSIKLPNGQVLGLVQPGSQYPAGTGIAIYWHGGATAELPALLDRARELGEPWALPGWPGVGVILGAECSGADAINQLTSGQIDGIVPVILPPDLAAAGKLFAEGGAAAGGLVDAFGDVIGGIKDTAAVTGGLIRALPWIVVGAAVLVAGIVVYKVVR